ncbi:MAG TPA: rod shape-determining protein MreD [Streptosporangiaceae bacterium]
MRRVLLSAVLVLVALVLQLSVLGRLSLPGGVTPDLVLLVVVGLALSHGPMAGLITGFCAGLALDIAPPSDHLIGLYALVFCLVGYGCGLISGELERSVLLPLGAAGLGAAGGAALYAAAGVMLGNPEVSGQAVRHVLPLSVTYDVLLSPFVLYGVALASRGTARLAGAVGGVGDLTPAAAKPVASRPGRTPRIRVAAARPRDGWIGGGGWLAASAELARSRPATVRLHLSGRNHGLASAASATGAAKAGSKSVARLRFGAGRRRDGVLGSGLLRGGLTGFNGLTGVTGGGLTGGGLLTGGLLGGRSAFGRSARRSWRNPVGPARTGPTRFSRRPSWGLRTTSPAIGSAPRKGSFSGGSARPGSYGGGAPRTGTLRTGLTRRRIFGTGASRKAHKTHFTGGAPRTTHLGGGSSRATHLSGGSSSGGSFGGNAPRRGAFSGSSRRGSFGRAALRRAAPRRGSLRGGSLRRALLGRRRWHSPAASRVAAPRRGSLSGGSGRRSILGIPLPGRSSGRFSKRTRKRTGGMR